MKSINPLLYGLNDFYKSPSIFPGSMQGSDSTGSLIGSLQKNTAISSRANDISEMYKVMKLSGNKDALAGFNETVKALVKDPDGKSLDNFIAFAKESVTKGKAKAFVETLADVNRLKAQGNALLGISIIKQAGKTCAEKDFSLAAKFIGTAESLMDRKYSGTQEMASAVGNFVSTWNAVLTQKGTSKEIPGLSAFADKVKSLDNDSLKTYLSEVNSIIKNANKSRVSVPARR